MSGSPRIVAGRYRVLSAIGSGGMGTVWRAHDDLLGVEVALKEVTLAVGLSGAQRAERVARAMREARSAARLRSNPHVVTVHDAVEQDGLPWIVMEYVPSLSLFDQVAGRGPLTPVEAARIGLAVLDALGAAHRLGVLHRDVKPSNILLADDGRVLLTDFGIATHEADPTLTRGGSVGTPQYMAPERLADGPASPSTDLFALGGTLYFAVEGRPPFQRDSAAATIGAIMFIEPDPMARAGPLEPVISALLAKSPAERADAADVLAGLTAVVQGAPPPQRRPRPTAGRDADPTIRQAVPASRRPERESAAPPANGARPMTPPDDPGRAWTPGAAPGPRRRLTAVIAAAAVAVAVGITLALVSLTGGSGSGGSGPGGGATTGLSVAATAVASDGPSSGPSSGPGASSPAPTASASASPSAAPSGPSVVPAAFLGTWTGTVHQGATTYPAKIVLKPAPVGGLVGTSEYPDLGCRANLFLTSATSSVLQVDERLIDQSGLCGDSDVTIALASGGTLRYSYPAGVLWSAGEATLSRS